MKIKNKALYRKITAAIACGLMFSMSSAVAYAGGEAPKNTATNGVYLFGVDSDEYTYATDRPAGWRLYDETNYQTVAVATKGGLTHGNISKDETGSNHELSVFGGGFALILGGIGNAGPHDNVVTIENTRAYFVCGGQAKTEQISSKNKVIILNGGGNVRTVYGGYGNYSFSVASGIARDNTVTLGDENNKDNAASISNNVFINAVQNKGNSIVSSGGGTLNVYNSGNKIGGDLHADKANVNFYINPTDMDAKGSKIMLKVGGTADLTWATVNGSVRNVADVADGDKITLLSAGTLKADVAKDLTITDGIATKNLSIKTEDNKIIAAVSVSINNTNNTNNTDNTNSLNSFKSMSNSFSADNVGRSVSGDDAESYNVDNEYDSMFLYGVDYKVGSTLNQAIQGTETVAVAVYDSNTNKYKGGLSNNEILAEDSASGHEFTVSGGDFLMVMGGYSQKKNSQDNVVAINGGNVYMLVSGGYSDQGSANSNKVIISSGLVSDVCGGYSGIGSANDNEVIISGGEVSDVCGGYSDQGSANNNKVIISGGEVGDVCGGYSDQGSASNNKVIISGGEVDNVSGGYSDCGLATGNTVTLGNANSYSGVAKVKESVVINAVYDNITDMYVKSAGGGTLNVYNSGNEIGGNLYADKANVNFYVNAADFNADGSKIMLNVVKTADLTGATVKASIRNIGDVASGSKITLLSAGTLKDDGASYGTLTDGIGAIKLDKSDNQIMVTISSSKNKKVKLDNSSPAKSPVETVAANIALINTGSDMLAGQGMDSASNAASNEAVGGSAGSMAPFACVGGGSLKLKSGSYVDLKSWNFNLGFAKEIKNNSGKLLFGPVFEYGRGNYESHLDVGTIGSGKSNYFGAGFMAKQTFNKGTYVEGSARIGRAKSDYKGALNGKDEVTYDNSTTYYAVHLGVGREVDLNAADSFDYYGKLFYSHQNGSTAHLSNNYDYDFAATNSVRTRLGFRYTHKTNDFSKYYAGLAWQHEFSSKCEADIRNNADGSQYIAPAPGMKGDTGILELGVKLKPNKSDKFEVDLGLAGYAGKQQGITANAQFVYRF